MPNRIIRESALTSATLYRLSDGAERLFWRMTLVADDYGRFESDPQVLKARCFPLWPDKRMSAAGVSVLYGELEQAELVKTYVVSGKYYGFFVTWARHQQKRAKHPKYPEPLDENVVTASASTCAQMPAYVPEKREARSEKRDTRGTTLLRSRATAHGFSEEAVSILKWLNEKASKNFLPVPAHLRFIEARLKEHEPWVLRKVVTLKVKEWGDDAKHRVWLRPKTLFNETNFANYVGELPALEMAEATRV
jgi:uncharacterized phage protein (TIGR02220 family)